MQQKINPSSLTTILILRLLCSNKNLCVISLFYITLFDYCSYRKTGQKNHALSSCGVQICSQCFISQSCVCMLIMTKLCDLIFKIRPLNVGEYVMKRLLFQRHMLSLLNFIHTKNRCFQSCFKSMIEGHVVINSWMKVIGIRRVFFTCFVMQNKCFINQKPINLRLKTNKIRCCGSTLLGIPLNTHISL